MNEFRAQSIDSHLERIAAAVESIAARLAARERAADDSELRSYQTGRDDALERFWEQQVLLERQTAGGKAAPPWMRIAHARAEERAITTEEMLRHQCQQAGVPVPPPPSFEEWERRQA